MDGHYLILYLIAIGIFIIPAHSLADMNVSSEPPPWFYGGVVGASFGDVEYLELSPMVGRNITPKMAVGVSFLYRYRNDKRFSESYSTSDYGATLFGRLNVTSTLYLQAEYEYIDYEIATINTLGQVVGKSRDDFASFLVGGGIQKSMGENTSMYITGMYNTNYDDDKSPYDTPVTIRFGIGVGF